MAYTKGNMGAKYNPEYDVITKKFLDNSAATHAAGTVMKLNNGDSDGEDYVSELTDTNNMPIGVLLSEVETTADQLEKSCDIQVRGIAMVKDSGSGVAAEAKLACTTAGEVLSYTSGTFSLGYALKTAAADDLFPCMLNIEKN